MIVFFFPKQKTSHPWLELSTGLFDYVPLQEPPKCEALGPRGLFQGSSRPILQAAPGYSIAMKSRWRDIQRRRTVWKLFLGRWWLCPSLEQSSTQHCQSVGGAKLRQGEGVYTKLAEATRRIPPSRTKHHIIQFRTTPHVIPDYYQPSNFGQAEPRNPGIIRKPSILEKL